MMYGDNSTVGTMESNNVNDFLEEMETFAEETSSWLSSSLENLGWDRDVILQVGHQKF